MADLKTTIISSMRNGKEVLRELEYAKKMGEDFTLGKGRVKEIIKKYYQPRIEMKVAEVIWRNQTTKTLRLVSKNGSELPVFRAGQFINVFVNAFDQIKTSRPYSISSSPLQRGYFEITVQKSDGGFVSHYLVDQVKQGDLLTVSSPSGYFVFNPIHQTKHTVFLAGGSGITPFISMIREIIERNDDREIDLIYGARDLKHALFHEELTHIAKNYPNIRYHLVISNDQAEKNYHQGFIDANLIKKLIKNPKDHTYFICGPQVMSEFVKKALVELEVKPKDIRHETFGASSDVKDLKGYPEKLSGQEEYTITFKGQEFKALANETILQAFERASLELQVVCRVGLCSLCRVKVKQGEVFIPEDVLLRHADEKYGYVHSCKTYPISDLVIEL